MIKTAMILMLSTYHHRKAKTATNEQIIKNIVQTFLKASSIIMQTKSSSVAMLKHYYCLNFVLSKPTSQLT